MRHRYLVAVVLLVALVGCNRGEGDAQTDDFAADSATYNDNGVTFEYPGDWDEFPAEASATSTGSNELWSATVGPDRTNLVNVTAYQLNVEVTEENLDTIEAELDQVISGVVSQAGGEIIDGPTAGEVAGLPAYTYTWENVEVDGEPKDSEAYFLFDGETEYFFNCQFSDATADEVRSGCDQILATFEAGSEA